MSIKRQLGGKKAKRNGQSFERNLIIEASYQDFAHIQIPDGCRQLGFNKLIRVKSPFDFVFVNNKSEFIFSFFILRSFIDFSRSSFYIFYKCEFF